MNETAIKKFKDTSSGYPKAFRNGWIHIVRIAVLIRLFKCKNNWPIMPQKTRSTIAS